MPYSLETSASDSGVTVGMPLASIAATAGIAAFCRSSARRPRAARPRLPVMAPPTAFTTRRLEGVRTKPTAAVAATMLAMPPLATGSGIVDIVFCMGGVLSW